MESTVRPFLEALEAWEAFYLMAGTAAVTLVGLLFVALSMHVAVLFRPEHVRTRAMAFQAFQGYLFVLITALVFLSPAQSPRALGATYVLMNAILFVRTVWRFARLPRGVSAKRRADRAWGLLVPALGYGAGVGLGALIITVGIPPGNLLMIPPLLILASATRTAWALLENVAHIEAQRADTAALSPAELVGADPVE